MYKVKAPAVSRTCMQGFGWGYLDCWWITEYFPMTWPSSWTLWIILFLQFHLLSLPVQNTICSSSLDILRNFHSLSQMSERKLFVTLWRDPRNKMSKSHLISLSAVYLSPALVRSLQAGHTTFPLLFSFFGNNSSQFLWNTCIISQSSFVTFLWTDITEKQLGKLG